MTVFTRIKDYRERFSRRQLRLAGIFISLLVVVGALGAGNAQRAAAVSGDCSENSIDNQDMNGGCGAANPDEMVADLQANNPSDLQNIYADGRIGLPPSLYGAFRGASHGVITRSGDLVVDDQTVMSDVWTMGRTTLGGKQPTPITIGGKTYFHSPSSASFADGVQSIPAMVLFDDEGTVQAAVMNPCGNPVTKGNRVKSNAVCKQLNKHKVDSKESTYTFTTDVELIGLAKIDKLDYFVDEGDGPVLFDTTTDPATHTQPRTFTKDAEVSVKVTIRVPGKKKRVITSEACKQQIVVKKVVKKERLKEKVVPVKQVTVPEVPAPPAPKPTPQVLSAAVMPLTGPGDVAGLFAGASALGAIGHRLYVIYRRKRR